MEARLPRIHRVLAALPAPPLQGLFAPLDALRSRLLRAFAPLARSLVVGREKRVALAASLLLALAYLGATTIPLWALAIGPIVWGIPHILSDIRYLVVRPGFHKRPLLIAVTFAGILAAALGAGVRVPLDAAIVALLMSRGSKTRRALGLAITGALLALAFWVGWLADLAFAHLRSAVAVGLWWSWRKRESRLHYIPLAIFIAGTLLLLCGAAEPVLARTGGHIAPWTGLSIRHLAWGLSPTTTGVWATRLVVLYAFAQSAHYIVWLRLIPEDDRKSPTPRSYAQTWRALVSDVGALILWGSLVGVLALIVWASFGVGAARDGYLKLAFFHGYLEIVAAAVLFAEGRPVAAH